MKVNINPVMIFDYVFGDDYNRFIDFYVIKVCSKAYIGNGVIKKHIGYYIHKLSGYGITTTSFKHEATFYDDLDVVMHQCIELNNRYPRDGNKTGYWFKVVRIHWWTLFWMYMKMFEIKDLYHEDKKNSR